MHNAVRPNPVAAMLDIVRVSLSFRKARSFNWPVPGLVCSQKNWKLARSISSSNCSSVPWYGAPPGVCSVRARSLLHASSETSGRVAIPFPHHRSQSLRPQLLCGLLSRIIRSLANVEVDAFAPARVRAYPDFDVAWVDPQLILDIPKSKSARIERKIDPLSLTRRKGNSFETLQRAHRFRDARTCEPHIELGNLFGRHAPRICDLGADGNAVFRIRVRMAQRFVQLVRAQFRGSPDRARVKKFRVRQSIAERELRGVQFIHVTRYELFIIVCWWTRQIYLPRRAAGIERVVVNGNLPVRARPAHHELAARDSLAKQNALDGRSRFDPRKPHRHDRRDMFKRPPQRERTAAKKQQHDGLPRRRHFLEQFLLPARQFEVGARGRLRGHFGSILPQGENGHIGLSRSGHGLIDVTVSRGSNLSALGVFEMLRTKLLGQRSS